MASPRKSYHPPGSKKPGFYWCEMWKENYYFFIGWTPEELSNYFNERWGRHVDASQSDGKCVEICLDDGTRVQCIWTRDESGPKLHSTLSHECIHAAYHTLDARGVKLDADNHEALTYLVELLIKKAIP